MSRRGEIPWTEQQIAALVADYGRVPTADIAQAMGRTRNSVIGCANRLGLKANRPAKVEQVIAPPPEPAPVGRVEALPLGRARHCQWERCNTPSVRGKSYCPEHASIVYRPMSEAERRRFIHSALRSVR